MSWPEVSIEDFPPERDDEPASLRQDILDELTDHFVCALNRELLKNVDERLARQRVMNQFGDPIKIARQLWFDAMKERIMSQRILTSVSVIVAACSIAVVGIAWMLMKDSQGVNQSIQGVNRRMLTQLAAIADRPETDLKIVESLQRSNDSIVRELKRISESQQSGMPKGMGAIPMSGSKAEEMHQISFQLVQDNQDKKPAVGFIGKLMKTGKDRFSIDVKSDEQGRLDFGRLPWAHYYLRLSAPWGEIYHQVHVNVVPGRDFSETIVCPAVPPKDVPVQFQVNWPNKLKSEDWILLCDFRASRSSRSLIQEDDHKGFFETTQVIQKNTWTYLQSIQTGAYLVTSKNKVIPCPLSKEGRFVDFEIDSLIEQPSINMKAGKYELPVIYLFRKDNFKQLAKLNQIDKFIMLRTDNFISTLFPSARVGLADARFRSVNVPDYTVITAPFERIMSEPLIAKRFGSVVAKSLCGIHLPKKLTFTASNTQQNLWEIDLPKMEFVPIEPTALSRQL